MGTQTGVSATVSHAGKTSDPRVAPSAPPGPLTIVRIGSITELQDNPYNRHEQARRHALARNEQPLMGEPRPLLTSHEVWTRMATEGRYALTPRDKLPSANRLVLVWHAEWEEQLAFLRLNCSCSVSDPQTHEKVLNLCHLLQSLDEYERIGWSGEGANRLVLVWRAEWEEQLAFLRLNCSVSDPQTHEKVLNLCHLLQSLDEYERIGWSGEGANP